MSTLGIDPHAIVDDPKGEFRTGAKKDVDTTGVCVSVHVREGFTHRGDDMLLNLVVDSRLDGAVDMQFDADVR